MVDIHMEAKQAVKVHKALGEPTRYKILEILVKESNLCPAELENRLDSVALSTLSHHLKQLTDCGLLDSQKRGTFVYFTVNEDIARKYVPYMYD